MKPKLVFIAVVSISYVGPAGCTLQNTSATSQLTEQKPAPIKQTVDSLRLIKVDSVEYNNIPPAAKALLTTLKHQLRDLIYTRVNDKLFQANPDELLALVLSDLKNLGVTVEEPEDVVVDKDYLDSYIYGDIYRIAIEHPKDHPHLLVATTTVGICCGTDTSLYVFQNDGTRWDLTLAQEANDYDDVSGAQGRFQYGISSPDTQNNFFVVAANVNPWCTSNWQSLRFKVLRPGQTAYEPRVLLSEERTIYLGAGFEDERSYRLKIHGNRFSLEFLGEKYEQSVTSGDGLDSDDSEILDVVSCKIIGDQVRVLGKGGG